MSTPRRVVLITGAARRIGAAIARRLHADGYDLALHYRGSSADMHALADELDAVRPDSTLMLQADLAVFDRLPELVAKTVGHFGRLDALVNNASAFYPTPAGATTPAQWEEVSAHALALFARGQALAADRGLILADTKYEFGLDPEGRIVLADEIHTPDSSRYWMADTYAARFEAGERPDSFDKDFVRSWVAERCDPYVDPIPAIPPEMIERTSDVYVDAFRRITGRDFEAPAPGEDIAARIRRNFALYVS